MTTTETTVARYEEMRLVVCPGCGDPLEQEHWDDLGYYDSEEYHCDCGTSFEVSRPAESMEVEVRVTMRREG